MRPFIACRTRPHPVQRMLSATPIATIESSGSQPVIATSPTPSTTPTEVHTSVSRCLPSATSVDGAVPSPGPEHQPPDDAVDHGRGHGDGESDAEVLQRLWADQPLHGRRDDEHGGHEDHQPLGAGREVLDLAVPEVVRVVGGAGRRW